MNYNEALNALNLTSLSDRRAHLCQVYIDRLRNENHSLHFMLPKQKEVVHNYNLTSGISRYTRPTCRTQPRPQGLLAFQYGGGRREDPGTQRTKTIADWCIPWCVHTCALIGLFLPKQRLLTFEGFVEGWKCFLQCLRPKRWTEFRSDCSENCDCTVGRQRFEDSDI